MWGFIATACIPDALCADPARGKAAESGKQLPAGRSRGIACSRVGHRPLLSAELPLLRDHLAANHQNLVAADHDEGGLDHRAPAGHRAVGAGVSDGIGIQRRIHVEHVVQRVAQPGPDGLRQESPIPVAPHDRPASVEVLILEGRSHLTTVDDHQGAAHTFGARAVPHTVQGVIAAVDAIVPRRNDEVAGLGELAEGVEIFAIFETLRGRHIQDVVVDVRELGPVFWGQIVHEPALHLLGNAGVLQNGPVAHRHGAQQSLADRDSGVVAAGVMRLAVGNVLLELIIRHFLRSGQHLIQGAGLGVVRGGRSGSHVGRDFRRDGVHRSIPGRDGGRILREDNTAGGQDQGHQGRDNLDDRHIHNCLTPVVHLLTSESQGDCYVAGRVRRGRK